MATAIPPNQSLYIQGLDDHVHKIELRKSLYYLFSQYGSVMDVVALKTSKMRGQAFIVFHEIASATSAMRSLQGFPFYNRPLKITYAKSKSNAVKIKEGSYYGGKGNAAKSGAAPSAAAAMGPQKRPRDDNGGDDSEDGDEGSSKRARNGQGAEDIHPPGTTAPSSNQPNPPNRILFLTNLPSSTTPDMLTPLFDQYPGFKEIRLVPGKSGIAFVEYDTVESAGVARSVLDGFRVTSGNAMGVEYARV
ncbi:uncharacterized protein EV422DRAFT_528884 [Fimicolochytrium jonesii]|uniref:uncharacterized protein n=1 Tax=Fimicolochytrium jonesii TaxID=1396493 RepID=UPI0022FE7C5C|nr:uncharacterized protein EV422DRAFT_528884 [Fimicolochytrium jonesii]KAI8821052.1 hypothetical protein EV422DRAFT_528884 [Fimicolochytrium jonesii]